MMTWHFFQNILSFLQRGVSFIGIIIIVIGVLFALYQYLYSAIINQITGQEAKINEIRLNLGRILILGLEFIVAADLIGTTTTPDYYSLGMLAIIVAIRTFLSFSLSREMAALNMDNILKNNGSEKSSVR